MEREIILWDDDIGWCERLRRELQKRNTAIEEAEGWDDLQQKIMKYAKGRSLPDGWQNGMQGGRELLAVVLSGQKLIEELPEKWQFFLRKICELGAVPVLYVGEREDVEQELQAFLMGAADYIDREKDIRVCAARIFACAGKGNRYQRKSSETGELLVDEETCQLYCGEAVFDLTPKECLVLSRLLADNGKVVSREELLFAAWGTRNLEKERVLDTVIKQLRRKLRPLSYSICSKYGVGYVVKRNLSKNAQIPCIHSVDN